MFTLLSLECVIYIFKNRSNQIYIWVIIEVETSWSIRLSLHHICNIVSFFFYSILLCSFSPFFFTNTRTHIHTCSHVTQNYRFLVRLIDGSLIHEIRVRSNVWENWRMPFRFSAVTRLWIARALVQRWVLFPLESFYRIKNYRMQFNRNAIM
jgi:hypothetical protein